MGQTQLIANVDTCKLILKGAFTAKQVADIRASWAQLLNGLPRSHIQIDMEDIDEADLEGVLLMLNMFRMLRVGGHYVTLAACSDAVLDVADELGFVTSQSCLGVPFATPRSIAA